MDRSCDTDVRPSSSLSEQVDPSAQTDDGLGRVQETLNHTPIVDDRVLCPAAS